MSSVESFKRRQRSHLGRVEGLASAAAGDSVVNGTFFVNNIGEGVKTVLFPVKSFHIPQMKLSYGVLDSVNVIEGRAPLLTAHVSDWNVIDNPPASRLFVGVSIRTVATGPANTKFAVHWSATGTAFTGIGLL